MIKIIELEKINDDFFNSLKNLFKLSLENNQNLDLSKNIDLYIYNNDSSFSHDENEPLTFSFETVQSIIKYDRYHEMIDRALDKYCLTSIFYISKKPFSFLDDSKIRKLIKGNICKVKIIYHTL